jgi:CRP-like cAMP-binding protein
MSDSILSILEHPQFPPGKCWREEAFEPNQTIIKEGEESWDLYLVVKGVVRVNMEIDIDAEHHIQSGLGELTAGDTFGELNLFGASGWSASVVALSATQLIRIDGKALSAFMDTHPELGYGVLKAFFLEHADLIHTASLRLSELYAWKLKQDDVD